MNRTLTLGDIADMMAARMPDTDRESTEAFVKAFFATAADGLKKDGKVKIRNFGSFELTGPEPRGVMFVPEKEMADSVNRPFSFFEAEELDDNVTEAMLDAAVADSDAETTPLPEPEAEPQTEPAHETESQPETAETTAEEAADAADAVIDTPSESPEPAHEPEPEPEQKVPEERQSEPEPEPTAEPHHDYHMHRDYYEHRHRSRHRRRWPWLLGGFVAGAAVGMAVAYWLWAVPQTIADDEFTETVETAVEPPVPADTAAPAAVSDTTDAPVVTQPSPRTVTDTVRSDRFLTTMAREHFGAMEFWAYIYIENQDKLGDPDRIAPKTVVVIPDAGKYGIDRNDKKSLEDAKQKCAEIYSKYRR